MSPDLRSRCDLLRSLHRPGAPLLLPNAWDVATASGGRSRVPGGRDDERLFPSAINTPLDPDNVRTRMLKPLVEEAGAPWAGWHTLRHTFASLQIARGANIVQLSRALGHHSPAFTLSVYAHLLEGEEAPALDLGIALQRASLNGSARGNGGATHPDEQPSRATEPRVRGSNPLGRAKE
jgi:integrase